MKEITIDDTLILLELEDNLSNTLNSFKQDLGKINIGRAQSDIFDFD